MCTGEKVQRDAGGEDIGRERGLQEGGESLLQGSDCWSGNCQRFEGRGRGERGSTASEVDGAFVDGFVVGVTATGCAGGRRGGFKPSFGEREGIGACGTEEEGTGAMRGVVEESWTSRESEAPHRGVVGGERWWGWGARREARGAAGGVMSLAG